MTPLRSGIFPLLFLLPRILGLLLLDSLSFRCVFAYVFITVITCPLLAAEQITEMQHRRPRRWKRYQTVRPTQDEMRPDKNYTHSNWQMRRRSHTNDPSLHLKSFFSLVSPFYVAAANS